MKYNLTAPRDIKKLLNKYNLNLQKKLGQNLLVDQNILHLIVDSAQLSENDVIIEIGSGPGALTQEILDILGEEGFLLAIEKDKKFIKVLKDLFGENPNLKLINKDVRDIDLEHYLNNFDFEPKKVKVMGNLPYYLATPLIIDLLEGDHNFSKMVFMVQKEVAERMVAAPGNKEFGALSVVIQFYSEPEIIHQVSSRVFIPQPDVDSSIIVLKPYIEPPYNVENIEFFFKVVKSIFQQRRKTIKNSLLKANVLNMDKDSIIQALNRSNIDSRIRGEKLAIEEMVKFSNALWQNYKKRSDKNEVYESG